MVLLCTTMVVPWYYHGSTTIVYNNATPPRQSRDARAESRRKEKQTLIVELTAKAEANAEQMARVAYHHVDGL